MDNLINTSTSPYLPNTTSPYIPNTSTSPYAPHTSSPYTPLTFSPFTSTPYPAPLVASTPEGRSRSPVVRGPLVGRRGQGLRRSLVHEFGAGVAGVSAGAGVRSQSQDRHLLNITT